MSKLSWPYTYLLCSESIQLNTPVVGLSSTLADYIDQNDAHPQHIDDMDDAIAVATGKLCLMPGMAFQARVSQMSQLNVAHKTVSAYNSFIHWRKQPLLSWNVC